MIPMTLAQLLNLTGRLSLAVPHQTKRRRQKHHRGVESLETRSLLTSFAWSDTNSLTISFAPDGTDIAGNSNELNADLNRLATPAEWQGTIVSAFQTWLSELGFDISVVNDNGASFGTNGATRGDVRFGDVRVGAVPLSSGVLATAIPQNAFVSGTWAGDMMLNYTAELTSLDELYSLALHEAGHILGLEHSTDPNSAMYHHSGLTVLAPTADDLNLLRSLYGRGFSGNAAVEQDDTGNDRPEHAERIEAVEPNGVFPRFEASGTILNSQDVDTFVFRPRETESESPRVTTIILRTKSPELIPQLSLLKSNGQKIEATVVANGNGLIILQSREVEADRDYIVRVQSSSTDPRPSHGDYAIAVTFSESMTTIEQLVGEKLDAERSQRNFVMYSAKSQLFNFQLSAIGARRQSTAILILSVYNDSKRLIFRVAVRPGDTATANTVLLSPGRFDLVVEGVSATDHSLPEMEFQIKGSVLSDDAGPLPNDPVSNPSSGTGAALPYVYPMNIDSSRPFIVQQAPRTTPPVTSPTLWHDWMLYYLWLAGGPRG